MSSLSYLFFKQLNSLRGTDQCEWMVREHVPDILEKFSSVADWLLLSRRKDMPSGLIKYRLHKKLLPTRDGFSQLSCKRLLGDLNELMQLETHQHVLNMAGISIIDITRFQYYNSILILAILILCLILYYFGLLL